MPISINPILPVIAAQGATPELVLQPGTVVDARVVQLLADNVVRIAIANLSIDVLSEIPLQSGQTLRLAVSQTEDGVRLAVVAANLGAAGASADTVTLAPEALIEAAANGPATATPLKNVLTPLEKLAVSTAAQSAATRQGSQASLFANLGVVAGSAGLPAKLQQAIAQVLAQQTSLDQNLTGNDIKNAFQKSGLFFEASLAAGSAPQTAGVPDLKAALIVLRQALLSSLGTSAAQGNVAPAAEVAPSLPAAATPALAPSMSPEIEMQEILLPQARVPVADDLWDAVGTGQGTSRAGSTTGSLLNLLQEALQEGPSRIPGPGVAAGMPGVGHDGDVTVHTNTPPPPFRGAQPSAQPVAEPSLAPNAPLATAAHHLLGDTDAAIARQTLFQVASLPDRVDVSGPRPDQIAPKWNFEIPFVTPQGTAMAQFEISRDGAGQEVEAARRVWRARFSLDVEPAGPIHALVSLTGDQTSVRMWAERPATAAQLRAGAFQLSQALSRAELLPGDIVIRDGAPPQSTPAPAGHFLDRAL